MALAGLRDSPPRQTWPEADLDSASTWVNPTGLNKTELRRTVHTCIVRMITEYVKRPIEHAANKSIFFLVLFDT